VTAAMPAHGVHAPRFTPVQAWIPRDPAAQDHGWPDRWPLRTQLELAALVTAPGCARAHVSAVLREWHADPGLTDTAALIVTEMMTNAVLSTHAHGYPDPVRMWMLSDRGSVLFLTWDATMPAPVLASAAPADEHGRGLALIDALCESWGFYHPAEQPGGKVVWALVKPEAPDPSRFLA
jgi:anti-sigma regulatory factor (Ser/Thr protein kinase)